jgi:2-(1,2-epoxy-1,2-dihydrophenyl)acetyl-CoA isomerase
MADESNSVVQLAVRDGIARITLNRPARKNAIDASVHSALRGALDRVEADSTIRVVVITGAGDAFCSGQDLAERAAQLAEGEVDLARSLQENYNPLVRRLTALPMPVIAVVNGIAAGAGAALALAADIVLAANSARFQLAFARVALGPDSGVSWILPRLIGQARAMGMTLTAEMIDAQRAESWGLIWRAVEDDALVTEAETLVLKLATGPQAALRAIKRRMRDASDQTLDMSLDAERDAQGALGAHKDYREAVEAFMSKRAPKFS